MTNTIVEEISDDHDSIIEVQHKFTEMCSNLNIESVITEQAWDEFVKIHSKVTLEVCYTIT